MEMGDSFWIYSGSSNLPLARALAAKLKTKLADVRLSRFPNGEQRVWVAEKKIPREAIIVQSLSQPVDEHLLELLFLADAVKRLGATAISAIIPWLGYSKQDKVFRPGEPLSIRVVAEILQTVPLKQILTFDLHHREILEFFTMPLVNLSARLVFADYFRDKLTPQSVVVTPDAGAVKNSREFARQLGLEIAYLDKIRDRDSGKVRISGLTKSVEGKDILILDDMIVTGATLLESTKFLRQKGAKTIRVAATHHLYVPGVQEALEQSPIAQIVVSDTVYCPKMYPKLKILSVVDLLAENYSFGVSP